MTAELHGYRRDDGTVSRPEVRSLDNAECWSTGSGESCQKKVLDARSMAAKGRELNGDEICW